MKRPPMYRISKVRPQDRSNDTHRLAYATVEFSIPLQLDNGVVDGQLTTVKFV